MHLNFSLHAVNIQLCYALIVVSQYFEVQVYDVFAIRGNAAIFKCQVPSFVGDHVDVVEWIDSNGGNYPADDSFPGSILYMRRNFTPLLIFIPSP